jgi:hypothetical protein
MPYKEGQLLLAIAAIEGGQIESIWRAAKVYDVSETTLRRRVKGTLARRDCTANSKNLTLQEEEDLIKHILDLDSRGLSPRYREVADMANHLLAVRGGKLVGKNWPYNFVERTSQLKTRFNRKYDYHELNARIPKLLWLGLSS